ncbi:MAG: four helix bundle protein [Bacteroidaceae bacterium]|nr:four helix bundle protein [Bacteroidaceae bacterium]MBR5148263.1 four helix bundle protein [Bacteroidaceae bacterium]
MDERDELFSYRNLQAYQSSKQLVTDIYSLLKHFPKEETYSLCDQLRRAVVSIPSNIAEGMGRVSLKEQIHFIEIAFGSLYEVMCQVEIAKDLGYITDLKFVEIERSVTSIAKMLSGLRAKRIKALTSNP